MKTPRIVKPREHRTAKKDVKQVNTHAKITITWRAAALVLLAVGVFGKENVVDIARSWSGLPPAGLPDHRDPPAEAGREQEILDTLEEIRETDLREIRDHLEWKAEHDWTVDMEEVVIRHWVAWVESQAGININSGQVPDTRRIQRDFRPVPPWADSLSDHVRSTAGVR